MPQPQVQQLFDLLQDVRHSCAEAIQKLQMRQVNGPEDLLSVIKSLQEIELKVESALYQYQSSEPAQQPTNKIQKRFAKDREQMLELAAIVTRTTEKLTIEEEQVGQLATAQDRLKYQRHRELVEAVEESLKEYAEGKAHRGSIDDLLAELED